MDESLAHDPDAQLFTYAQSLDDDFLDDRDDEDVSFLTRLRPDVDELIDRRAFDLDPVVPHRNFDELRLADDAPANSQLSLRRGTYVDLHALLDDGNRRTAAFLVDREVTPAAAQLVSAVGRVIELGERHHHV